MAKGNQMADTSRKKGAKMEDKVQIHSNNGKNNNTKKKKKTNTSNGTDNDNKKDEPEVLVVSDSSVDSKNNDGDEVDEALQVQDTDEDEEEDEEEDAKSSGITNQRINKAKNSDEKEKNGATKKKKKSKYGKNKKNESSSDVSHCFPMNRISRIVKSEDPDIRISQEAVFLINKASEKFLEVFCKDAYACAFLDHKSQVWYKHLSSVVSKRRRFDFLADFVPEKVKAEDTSADASIAET
ncbi:unnamed protein product [Camellia sinensis]